MKIEELKNTDVVMNVTVKDYISVVEKMAIAKLLVNSVVTENEHGVRVYNSTTWEIAKDVAFITTYTDIDVTDNDYDNYDMLKISGCLAKIIETIEDEYYDFIHVCDNELDDYLCHNSIEMMAAKTMSDIVAIVDRTMGGVEKMLDKGDPNTIAKYLSKGIEMIGSKLPDFSNPEVINNLKRGLK